MLSFKNITSPMDQFEVRNLLSLDVPLLGNINMSITNIGLYLIIGVLIVLSLNLFATNNNKIVSNNWSISQESIYATIHSIVVSQINAAKGQIYFPFIYSLFIFILINNLLGMVEASPYDNIDNIFTLSSLLITNKKVKGNSYSVNCKYSTSSSSNNNSKGSLLNPYYLTGFIDALAKQTFYKHALLLLTQALNKNNFSTAVIKEKNKLSTCTDLVVRGKNLPSLVGIGRLTKVER